MSRRTGLGAPQRCARARAAGRETASYLARIASASAAALRASGVGARAFSLFASASGGGVRGIAVAVAVRAGRDGGGPRAEQVEDGVHDAVLGELLHGRGVRHVDAAELVEGRERGRERVRGALLALGGDGDGRARGCAARRTGSSPSPSGTSGSSSNVELRAASPLSLVLGGPR